MLTLQGTQAAMSASSRRRWHGTSVVQTLPSAQYHLLFRSRARCASRGDADALASGGDCCRAAAKVRASDVPPQHTVDTKLMAAGSLHTSNGSRFSRNVRKATHERTMSRYRAYGVAFRHRRHMWRIIERHPRSSLWIDSISRRPSLRFERLVGSTTAMNPRRVTTRHV
jgi:hypothetical protein